MEVYFKNLTPEEGIADKLLHELNVLGENTEELFLVSQGKITEQAKDKFMRRLERIKSTCRALQEEADLREPVPDAAAQAYPYITMGIVFSLGILMATVVNRKQRKKG